MGGCKFPPFLPSCSIVWGVPVNTPGLRMHHSSGFRAVPFSALTKHLSEGGKKSFASPLSPTLHGNRGSGAEAGSSYPSGGKRESSLWRCWGAQRDSIYRQGKAFQQHAEWLTVWKYSSEKQASFAASTKALGTSTAASAEQSKWFYPPPRVVAHTFCKSQFNLPRGSVTIRFPHTLDKRGFIIVIWIWHSHSNTFRCPQRLSTKNIMFVTFLWISKRVESGNLNQITLASVLIQSARICLSLSS